MEIQSFVLCKTLIKAPEGNAWNAELIALHNFFPTDGKYPLTFSMPYYLLLRREQRSGDDEEVTIRFNLIDVDGRKCGTPYGFCRRRDIS